MKSAIVTVYSHVEFYPPTINAIEILSEEVGQVHVLQRNTKISTRVFHKNVIEHNSGSHILISETQVKSYWWKLKSFINFTKQFYSIIKTNKPELVLIYDPIPLLAFRILKIFLNTNAKVWYHNHDVLTKNNVSLFSISWFAMYNEQYYINNVDVFTLPTDLRKSHFPFYKNEILLLPNYPSKYLINEVNPNKYKNEDSKKIRIIYQGVITDEHGIEEIIHSASLYDSVELSIVGVSSPLYIDKLNQLIASFKLEDRVKIHPFFNNYLELLKFTAEHDAGIGYYKQTNEMNKTMGTASNKIFEYLACGLFVLLEDSDFYRNLFKKYNCIVYSEINQNAINNAIEQCIKYKSDLKKDAKNAFEQEFYFENNFNPIFQKILNDIH